MGRKGEAHRTLFCDTNVLVRVLTGQPPHQAKAARTALRAAPERLTVRITDVVVAELAYVLTNLIGMSPLDASGRIRQILAVPGLETSDASLLAEALDICVASQEDGTT